MAAERAGQQLIDEASAAMAAAERMFAAILELWGEHRERLIRQYEPERCCPNCDFIAHRGERFTPCPGSGEAEVLDS